MNDLYVLAYFDKDTHEFIEFVRKGRNRAISGYDDLDSAKRGYSQSKRSHRARTYELRIVKADGFVIIEEAVE